MRLHYAAAGLMAVLALSACQRTSYSDMGPSSSASPAPLQAQPVPSVQSSQLPDPTTSTTGGTGFPSAPTQTASAVPGAAPATAMDVKKEGMVGNWRVASGPNNCDMFLTLTNLGSGSRGGTRGCAGELTAMGSWEVSGKQVMLKDRNGNPIGNLYKTADNRYEGTTASGQPITLSR